MVIIITCHSSALTPEGHLCSLSGRKPLIFTWTILKSLREARHRCVCESGCFPGAFLACFPTTSTHTRTRSPNPFLTHWPCFPFLWGLSPRLCPWAVPVFSRLIKPGQEPPLLLWSCPACQRRGGWCGYGPDFSSRKSNLPQTFFCMRTPWSWTALGDVPFAASSGLGVGGRWCAWGILLQSEYLPGQHRCVCVRPSRQCSIPGCRAPLRWSRRPGFLSAVSGSEEHLAFLRYVVSPSPWCVPGLVGCGGFFRLRCFSRFCQVLGKVWKEGVWTRCCWSFT